MSSFPKRFGAAISVLVATRVKTGGKGIRSLKCFRIVNQHDLDRDFAKEGPDYTRNKEISDVLSQLQLQSGEAQIAHNLHRLRGADRCRSVSVRRTRAG